MNHVADLPLKLDMMLKAMSLSRVCLAQRLGVDKSLVGRWLAGAVHPTEHNLARLTALVAEGFPGFRLADWFAESAAIARRFGVDLAPPPSLPAAVLDGPLAAFLEAARPELAFRGRAYEGFWRASRPSLLIKDRIFHDYGLIRQRADGMIEVRMEGSGLDFTGFLFPVGGNVFVFLFDSTGRTPVSVLFKGTPLPRAAVLDGILQFAALDPDRTPAALPVVLERVGDLSGDRAADDERFRAIVRDAPEPGDPPAHLISADELAARLYREIGHTAAEAGGEAFLSVGSAHSLSRGMAGDGLSG